MFLWLGIFWAALDQNWTNVLRWKGLTRQTIGSCSLVVTARFLLFHSRILSPPPPTLSLFVGSPQHSCKCFMYRRLRCGFCSERCNGRRGAVSPTPSAVWKSYTSTKKGERRFSPAVCIWKQFSRKMCCRRDSAGAYAPALLSFFSSITEIQIKCVEVHCNHITPPPPPPSPTSWWSQRDRRQIRVKSYLKLKEVFLISPMRHRKQIAYYPKEGTFTYVTENRVLQQQSVFASTYVCLGFNNLEFVIS